MACPPVRIADTWLEAEEFCYPHGGMTRRAYVRFPDGVLRLVWCGIPDTYFSIPARTVRYQLQGRAVKGFITSDESGFTFHIPA
jgi:hypothetical protein